MEIDFNKIVFAGNELWRVLSLFGVITVALVAAKVVAFGLRRSAGVLDQRGRNISATGFKALARSTGLLAVAVAFPIGMAFIQRDEALASIGATIKGVLFSIAIGFTLYQLVDVIFVWMQNYASKSHSKMDDMLVPIVRTSLHITVVVLTVLQIAQTLTDRPLTSLIAGLGVGGLAVALAAQDTIKHFFGSVVLFADSPFQVGDRIVVESIDGNVEEVGFRSTRIRTLEGHLVTIPNGDLANKVIVNIAQRPHIRHRAIINVTYDTPPEKLQRALQILRELLESHEGLNRDFPPRVLFDEFAASSLNILVMFWYHPPDYWSYKAYTEKLYLAVLTRFNEEGIQFAFPTQTIHLAGNTQEPIHPSIRIEETRSGDKAS